MIQGACGEGTRDNGGKGRERDRATLRQPTHNLLRQVLTIKNGEGRESENILRQGGSNGRGKTGWGPGYFVN